MKAIYINGSRVTEEEASDIVGSRLLDAQCKGICEQNISWEYAHTHSRQRIRERAIEIALDKLISSGWCKVDDEMNDECNWIDDSSLGLKIEYKEVFE